MPRPVTEGRLLCTRIGRPSLPKQPMPKTHMPAVRTYHVVKTGLCLKTTGCVDGPHAEPEKSADWHVVRPDQLHRKVFELLQRAVVPWRLVKRGQRSCAPQDAITPRRGTQLTLFLFTVVLRARPRSFIVVPSSCFVPAVRNKEAATSEPQASMMLPRPTVCAARTVQQSHSTYLYVGGNVMGPSAYPWNTRPLNISLRSWSFASRRSRFPAFALSSTISTGRSTCTR